MDVCVIVVGVSSEPLLYSVVEVAGKLGISRAMLYRLIKDGDLPTVRIGRRTLITADALNAYVQELTAT